MKKWDSRYKGGSASTCEGVCDMETILIVLLVLFLLGGGGWGYSLGGADNATPG